MTDWINLEDERPPNGKVVLVNYVEEGCKPSVHLASYAGQYEVEADDEAFGDLIDYCEADDIYYAPEGWYQFSQHHEEYGLIYMPEGGITHWAVRPASPLRSLPDVPAMFHYRVICKEWQWVLYDGLKGQWHFRTSRPARILGGFQLLEGGLVYKRHGARLLTHQQYVDECYAIDNEETK